ncbi:hypothetical protein FIBSPDRAFT_871792 [Athelia psychrophila]|uniref:Uncharacterized protein n=1 Tax=Athelia psychrophila TaxID=1759441 RepID=A0A166A1D6_9AGAM|nr:hypothetical protein FIBSPDRAFT_871792 [Fibularhizoctonia sp. CBS 109695]
MWAIFVLYSDVEEVAIEVTLSSEHAINKFTHVYPGPAKILVAFFFGLRPIKQANELERWQLVLQSLAAFSSMKAHTSSTGQIA